AAAVLLGDVGDRLKLRRGEEAAGQLGADHHHAVLALAVDAVEQAEAAPLVGRQLAALVGLQALDEQIDVGLAGKPQAARGDGGRDIDDAHSDLSAGWASGARTGAGWDSESIAPANQPASPITSTPGRSVAIASPPEATSPPSVVSWVKPPGCDAPNSSAAGVASGQPRAISRPAIAPRALTPIRTTRVIAPGAMPSRIG